MTAGATPDGADVLVVDDDAAIVRSLERGLRLEGFRVRTAGDGREALAAIEEQRPDALVLDIAMPGLDGLELTSLLRGRGDDAPICVLSARDELDDRLAGLRAGADDYLVKPFSLDELVARLHALLRRRPDAPSVPVTVAGVHVDPVRRTARRGSRELDLTRREFDLLEVLARHPGQVLSRLQLLDMVWGLELDTETNTVDVFVGYLRRKLEADGEPRLVHTVRGVGFRFAEDPDGPA